MHIIDRRLNPGGKSLANRQRFLRRAKALVQRGGAREPRKDREHQGHRPGRRGRRSRSTACASRACAARRAAASASTCCPATRNTSRATRIPRPRGGGGGGGSEGSPDGERRGRVPLRRCRARNILDLFLEDLELPDLAKRALVDDREPGAGAAPAIRSRLARQPRARAHDAQQPVAPHRAAAAEAARRSQALEEEIERARGSGGDEPSELAGAARRARARCAGASGAIPYIDPIDVRYRRFEPTPKPVAQAVMFCLMDVSGSMTEHMKDLAKRFYMLLYLFLKRRYQHVEVVFIRHTHEAEEVDEETFFHSRETGGTVVSTALEEMKRVVAERYPPDDWNIYAAQASDGDNTLERQRPTTAALLRDAILPLCQYFAYLEVGREDGRGAPASCRSRASCGGPTKRCATPSARFAMRKVRHRARHLSRCSASCSQRKSGAGGGRPA